MIVKFVEEMKISVFNSQEEYQLKMILDAIGVRYKIEENAEEGCKVIRINLQNL